VSVGGLITLTGCSQQSSQPSEESDAEGASGEFGIKQFRVGGENPDEYEAEFISGSSPESVADELTPEVSYRISGASGEVETEVRYEYSDATIPEDEPLDETVEADTHEGNGGYAQSPSMPDSLVSEILQNPKNLAVTFRATDAGSEGQASREYELNFADSYVEQIQQQAFSQKSVMGDLEDIEVNDEEINIDYNSNHEIGSLEFNRGLAGVAGLYSSNIGRTRIPYELELSVETESGEEYVRNISSDLPKRHLQGEITEDRLGTIANFEKLES
jgi:hypothetical protein